MIATTTGKPLLPAYGIRTFNGVKVAFIGMTLKATPTIVTPTGMAGLEFRDEAQTVNALIPKLRAQGIEAIVVLIHEGGFQTGTLGDINGCACNLAGSAIAGIVGKFETQLTWSSTATRMQPTTAHFQTPPVAQFQSPAPALLAAWSRTWT